MKTKILIALSLSFLTVGCTATMQQALVDNCDTAPPVPCIVGGDKNKVTMNVNAAKLGVHPATVCSSPGDTIVVTVKPTNTPVTVVTVPKDATNGWILETNVADPNVIEISVPANASTGDYDYLFITSEGKCYDPRIRIDPS